MKSIRSSILLFPFRLCWSPCGHPMSTISFVATGLPLVRFSPFERLLVIRIKINDWAVSFGAQSRQSAKKEKKVLSSIILLRMVSTTVLKRLQCSLALQTQLKNCDLARFALQASSVLKIMHASDLVKLAFQNSKGASFFVRSARSHHHYDGCTMQLSHLDIQAKLANNISSQAVLRFRTRGGCFPCFAKAVSVAYSLEYFDRRVDKFSFQGVNKYRTSKWHGMHISPLYLAFYA